MPETVNLQKSYSALNEKLAKLYDESGVRRSFTVPYVEGQTSADHIAAVGQAANNSGGLTANLITTAHHSNGKGWGSGDGHTTGHPGEKLRQTIIPKDDPNAKAVIAAAQKCINNFKFLLGDDDPTVQNAQGHLDLVKKSNAAGMNLFDLGVLVLNIMLAPTQAVGRAHAGAQPGGHDAKLHVHQEAAGGGAGTQETPQGGEQAGGEPPTATSAAPEAAGASAAASAVPEQAQG